jgi:hypothetical protein
VGAVMADLVLAADAAEEMLSNFEMRSVGMMSDPLHRLSVLVFVFVRLSLSRNW